MLVLLRTFFRVFAIVFAVSISSAQTNALAQSSVLPSGGGKALLDTSDPVILLLDHQMGLFQTEAGELTKL